MLLKVLTVVLTILLVAETAFILLHRRPSNRFERVAM